MSIHAHYWENCKTYFGATKLNLKFLISIIDNKFDNKGAPHKNLTKMIEYIIAVFAYLFYLCNF